MLRCWPQPRASHKHNSVAVGLSIENLTALTSAVYETAPRENKELLV